MNAKIHKLVRAIHLYTSLCILLLLLMYIATSYMMIYHDFIPPNKAEEILNVKINPSTLAGESWKKLLTEQEVDGRLVKETVKSDGEIVIQYAGAGSSHQLIVKPGENVVEIRRTIKNVPNTIIGYHRLRGFGGPWKYNVYAALLDLTGIGLILFAITGILLWLSLLKYNKIAWIVLVSGFIYVAMVVGYLAYF